MEAPTPRVTSPWQLRGSSLTGVLRSTATEFRDDNLTDWAAALTCYSVLGIFPALLILVSILGLVGESATQPLIDNVQTVAPGPAQEIFTNALENIQDTRKTAGMLFVVALATALWAASGYVGAFMRASNSIYEMEEGRPLYKTLPVRFGLTLVLVVLLAATVIGVTITGGLAQEIGDLVGVGSTAVEVWQIAKWPVLLFIVSLMVALLYWAAPNVKQPGFRWISPGSLLAVFGWVVGSAAFTFYVSNLGAYNKTYGALGGVIVFLIWLWLSNLMVLLGAELNAVLERGRKLEPRDAPG
jgi:membrane protein